MPRPKNKLELLAGSEQGFNQLTQYVRQLTVDQRTKPFPKQYLNRNIRDVLAHLHHWHLLFLDWYKVGSSGQKPAMPAKGYSWKTTPDLNRMIQKKYSEVPYEEVMERFIESHKAVTKIIEGKSNEELFTKKRYKWTGSTSLGAYLVSATVSHYQWAEKLIKKCVPIR